MRDEAVRYEGRAYLSEVVQVSGRGEGGRGVGSRTELQTTSFPPSESQFLGNGTNCTDRKIENRKTSTCESPPPP